MTASKFNSFVCGFCAAGAIYQFVDGNTLWGVLLAILSAANGYYAFHKEA